MFQSKYCKNRRNLVLPYSFLVLTLLLPLKSGAQTVDPDFPLVNVADTNAVIDPTVQKVYVTTVGLIPTTSNSIFIASTFQAAAVPFYSVTVQLAGYVSVPIENIVANQVNPNLILVTYNVIYNLETLLLTSSGADDSRIQATLGNYTAISTNIGDSSNSLFSFYLFEPSAANFQFTGQSVCNQAGVSCAGNTQCVETLTGTSVICQSPCKQGYCLNRGTCTQTDVLATPTCTCLSSSDVWFLGERCETMVALWMVILAVVASLILIIIAIVLACCFYRSKQRKKEKEALKNDFSGLSAVAASGYPNTAYLRDEPYKIETTAASANARNGFHPRLEARPEPIVFRNQSSDSRDRRQRRSLSLERPARRHQRSRSRNRSTSYDSNSSVSSYDDQTSSEASSQEKQVSKRHPPQLSRRSSSSEQTSSVSSSPNPRSATTDPHEFGDAENDVDISTRDQGTSPIRWLPPAKAQKGKIDISERKGWFPSLGPKMFELGTQGNNDNVYETTLPGPSSRITDTDI